MKKMMLVLFLCSSVFSAEEKIKIAVMDLAPKDVPYSVASTVSDFIRNDLFNTGKYSVLERSNLDKLLKEQSLQMTGCTSTDCAVEIGKILNMKQMVVGSIGRIGTRYFLNIRIVDVETTQMINSVSESCDSDSDLPELSKFATQKLVGNTEVKREPTKTEKFKTAIAQVKKARRLDARTPEEIAWRSLIIPGSGQVANGQDLKGYAITTLEILAIGATVYTYILHNQAVDDYNAAGAGSDFPELVKKETDLRNLNTISFWAAVGIWAYGVVDPFIFEPQKQGFVMKPETDGIQIAYRIKF